MQENHYEIEDKTTEPVFLREGKEACRKITKKYGTSFYFATRFFTSEIKEGIYAIYAFARIPDEIVDDPEIKDNSVAIRKLEEWIEEFRKAFSSGRSGDIVLNFIVKQFHKYKIPKEDCDAFFRSMRLDKEKFTYQNYPELEEYMYGSAGVIGLMVTRVVGYKNENAFEYAKKLGYAFQLTNFLRDIREDYEQLGRIYMPLDEMERFGLSNSDIAAHCRDERFRNFMQFQIDRNRQIYREAFPGIKLLNWQGRLAVRIAYVLYKAILNEIEKANYDVFAKRVRTNKQQKILLSLKALAGVYE
jgi:phytoene synthase